MSNIKEIRAMKKKAYETPQMEIMNMSVLSMMAISDFNSNVFDGNQGEQTGEGNARKRRNSWGNTNW